jgi:predicted transcriptional regulator
MTMQYGATTTMRAAMSALLTVRLNDDEVAALDRLVRSTGKSRSDLVREALRAQALRETMRLLHEALGPQARATGWLTEDDILRDVS